MEPVLVAGAAGGRQGSTGRHVVDLLLARGCAVRAFVHTDDARAAELRALGADVVVGDLREITDVLAAVRGVRRAYFTYPVTDGLVDAAGVFAAAARHEGLDRVVAVSQLGSAPDAGTPHMRRHWVAEQVFDRAGVGAVHLRAAVFFENLTVLVAARGWRELAVPLGPPETMLPLIAAHDVARVAAALLADPNDAGPNDADPNDAARNDAARNDTGDTDPICRLTGQMASVADVVATFGAALGHEVRYVHTPAEAWRREALELYRDAHAVEHLANLWGMFHFIGSGHPLYQVTEAIERIGGEPPLTLLDHLRARLDSRAAPAPPRR